MVEADLARLALDLHMQAENCRILLAGVDAAFRQNHDALPPSTKATLYATRHRVVAMLDASTKANFALKPLTDVVFPHGIPAENTEVV